MRSYESRRSQKVGASDALNLMQSRRDVYRMKSLAIFEKQRLPSKVLRARPAMRR